MILFAFITTAFIGVIVGVYQGFTAGQQSIKDDCDQLGRFHIDNTVYECHTIKSEVLNDPTEEHRVT